MFRVIFLIMSCTLSYLGSGMDDDWDIVEWTGKYQTDAGDTYNSRK